MFSLFIAFSLIFEHSVMKIIQMCKEHTVKPEFELLKSFFNSWEFF